MILLDTSVLIDALCGARRSGPALHSLFDHGERTQLTTLVLYEWWRGPRRPEELRIQESIWPAASAIAFDADDASAAAELYQSVRAPRGREIDLAIAACAIRHGAKLWTLNVKDFRDISALELFDPR